jgi:hypothetical protein
MKHGAPLIPPKSVSSVFSYRYYLADEAGSESFWFLMFYNDTSLFITRTPSTATARRLAP